MWSIITNPPLAAGKIKQIKHERYLDEKRRVDYCYALYKKTMQNCLATEYECGEWVCCRPCIRPWQSQINLHSVFEKSDTRMQNGTRVPLPWSSLSHMVEEELKNEIHHPHFPPCFYQNSSLAAPPCCMWLCGVAFHRRCRCRHHLKWVFCSVLAW